MGRKKAGNDRQILSAKHKVECNETKLICLADANPQKQGRLSPGYNLRVVDPSELRAINPDRIVILAWRYAEMIQQQHPEFAGKWLLPLPELVTA